MNRASNCTGYPACLPVNTMHCSSLVVLSRMTRNLTCISASLNASRSCSSPDELTWISLLVGPSQVETQSSLAGQGNHMCTAVTCLCQASHCQRTACCCSHMPACQPFRYINSCLMALHLSATQVTSHCRVRVRLVDQPLSSDHEVQQRHLDGSVLSICKVRGSSPATTMIRTDSIQLSASNRSPLDSMAAAILLTVYVTIT